MSAPIVALGEVDARLDCIWETPGGLNVRRRAPALYRHVSQQDLTDPLTPIDWVNMTAMAVSEEKASGGRIVTAPTNGAAGIIPAVGDYYRRFVSGASSEGIKRYLLIAIGALYKENALISGAEVGCQGEVGVACSMAAGGLVAAMGGSNNQIEYAAEVGMVSNGSRHANSLQGNLSGWPGCERN